MTVYAAPHEFDRERLIHDLEEAIVCGLGGDALQARLGWWARWEDSSQPVSAAAVLDQAVEEGLEALGDQQLVTLANEFELLQTIQVRVVEAVVPAWIDVFDRLSGSVSEVDGHAPALRSLPEQGWYGFLDDRTNEAVSPAGDGELQLSSVAQHACQALGERRIHEGCAVSRIIGLPDKERTRVIEWLRVLVDRMRVMKGKYFLALDEEFHRCLGRYSAAPRHVLNDAISFITMHGQRTIEDASVRADICHEHEAIIEQLARRDDEAAFNMVVEHLRNAQLRWFPHLVADIQKVNRSFFELLTADCALWYLSPNVLPVEAVPQNYESSGRAAVAAIERGATLLYITWTDTLLVEGQQHGLAVRRNEPELRESMSQFRHWVAGQLISPTRTADEAQRLANERVIHFTIDLETRFAYIDRSYGFFRQPDGDGILTHRESIRNPYEDPQVLERCEESSVQTWHKIDRHPKSFNENREFVWTIDRILRHLAGGNEPDASVAARLHARWYNTNNQRVARR
jgi:hypothetical protein